jgi:hypothetical protein
LFLDLQVFLAKTVSKLVIGKLAKGGFKENGKLLPIISPIIEDPQMLEPIHLCNLEIDIPNVSKLSGDLSVP